MNGYAVRLRTFVALPDHKEDRRLAGNAQNPLNDRCGPMTPMGERASCASISLARADKRRPDRCNDLVILRMLARPFLG
jgi:hypothetical protein